MVANSGAPKGLTAFARNASTGGIVRRPGPDGCISPDGSGADNGATVPGACRADARVGRHGHVRFFGNSQIYAGFFDEGRITVLKRDFYPTCQNGSVTVRRGAATAIPLTCSDRNGDPVTRVIAQAPTAGTLGAVNQATGSVFYNPFRTFSGVDRFTYRGLAAGLDGPCGDRLGHGAGRTEAEAEADPRRDARVRLRGVHRPHGAHQAGGQERAAPQHGSRRLQVRRQGAHVQEEARARHRQPQAVRQRRPTGRQPPHGHRHEGAHDRHREADANPQPRGTEGVDPVPEARVEQAPEALLALLVGIDVDVVDQPFAARAQRGEAELDVHLGRVGDDRERGHGGPLLGLVSVDGADA